jgi:hypothetical protein
MMVELEGKQLHIVYCSASRAPIGPHGWYSAVADAAGIARLQRGPNIGVACGKINNIVIVDVDNRNGGAETFTAELAWLPPTREHRSRSGGRHLIYKYPVQGIRNFSGSKGRWPGIDILSDGKGALWPPSSGYEVVDDRPLHLCPDRLCDLIRGMGVTVKPDASDVTPVLPVFPEPIEFELNYARRALLNAWYELHNCPAGCRNHLLNVLAYKMGRLVVRGWVKRDRVEDYLLRACAANGLLAEDGEKQCRDTLASGIKAGMQLPYHDIRWRVAKATETKGMGVTLKPEEEPK